MTRARAVELMDTLTALGYTVKLLAASVPPGHMDPSADKGVRYVLTVPADLNLDHIDLAKLMEVAERLDFHVTLHMLNRAEVAFIPIDKTPAVCRSPRRHPRESG